MNPAKQCSRRWGVTKGKRQTQRIKVDRGRYQLASKNRLHFRCERHALWRNCVIQRLYPEVIPSHKERRGSGIPNCKCEYAIEVVRTLDPVVLIRPQDYFGVGFSAEVVTFSCQTMPQLAIVVQLAVIYKPCGTIATRHRLITTDQVDDR